MIKANANINLIDGIFAPPSCYFPMKWLVKLILLQGTALIGRVSVGRETKIRSRTSYSLFYLITFFNRLRRNTGIRK